MRGEDAHRFRFHCHEQLQHAQQSFVTEPLRLAAVLLRVLLGQLQQSRQIIPAALRHQQRA